MAFKLSATVLLSLIFCGRPIIPMIEATPLNNFIHHFEPLNYDSRPLDVQQLNTKQESPANSPDQTPDDTINLEVFAFGRLFFLQLSPFPSIVSHGAELNIVNSEGIRTTNMASHLYKGILLGDKYSSVHGHIMNGTFDGVIKTKTETFHIEPSSRYFSSPQPGFHSVVYRARDIHLQDHLDENDARPCQLCSVSWDSSKVSPSDEKYVLSRHNLHSGPEDIFSDILSSANGDRDASRGFRPIAPSNSRVHVDIFETMWSLSDQDPPQNSLDQHRSRSSRDAEQPAGNFNTSGRNETRRGEQLTDYDQTAKTCVLHVVVDHRFFEHVANGDVTMAVAEVAYHIGEADSVYRHTDFDGDGFADNVGLAIGGMTIFESAGAPNYLISGDYQDAEEFLTDFSLYNFSAYCMGLAFTYRDFAGGVLGLAWMGYPDTKGPPGGICQRQLVYRSDGRPSSLNTAVVTLVNYGTYVPRSVSVTSVMHELGHGFGSSHDPQTPHCTPSGLQGNYIMYSQATDGSRPNNARFSSCSRSQMAMMIAAKGAVCLQAHTGPYCGNGLVEPGEECDCGTASMCALADSCCTPKGGMGSDAECTLRRELSRVCSPLTSACCDDDCHVIPASWHKHCSTDNECLRESFCNAECPQPGSMPDGFPCGGGAKRCSGGDCILSACYDLGLVECFCSDANNTGQSCQLCCQVDDECVPAILLGLTTPDGGMIKKQPGSACDNHTGYCDLQGFCMTIDTDAALDRLKNLYTEESKARANYWIRTNWYYLVCGSLCLLFLSASAKLSFDNRHYMRILMRRACHYTYCMGHTGDSLQTGAAGSQSAVVITSPSADNARAALESLNVLSPGLASLSETRV